MRLVYVFVLVLSVVATAEAEPSDALTAIGNGLTKSAKVCASFSQEKFLRALNRPLRSGGRMIFMKDTGLLWQVERPFPARVLIKEDALISWDDQDTPKRSGIGTAPVFRAMAQVFLAAFSTNVTALREVFEVTVQEAGENWEITLLPKDSTLSSIIKDIGISGGKFIRRISFTEQRGDETVLQFTGMQTDLCTLSAREREYIATP